MKFVSNKFPKIFNFFWFDLLLEKYDNVAEFADFVTSLVEKNEVGIVNTKVGEWYRDERSEWVIIRKY